MHLKFNKLLVLFAVLICSNLCYASLSPRQIFELANKSVVFISADVGGNKVQGSGVVFKSGFSKVTNLDYSYVITNAHVVANYKSVNVIASDRASYLGSVVAYNRDIDLAVVRIDGVKLIESKSKKLSAAHVTVGDRVYAIGSPKGLNNSLSEGLISGLRTFKSVKTIQTSAPISPGSSGGGLFDVDANLIGITTFKYNGGENLNFAVDISHVKDLDLVEINYKTNSVGSKANNIQADSEAHLNNEHPDWREIVKSKDFDSWLSSRYSSSYLEIIKSNDGYLISKILSEYKKYLVFIAFDPSKINCNPYVKKPLRESIHCQIRDLRARISEAERVNTYAKQRMLPYDRWVLEKRLKLIDAYENGSINYDQLRESYFKDLDAEEDFLRKMP